MLLQADYGVVPFERADDELPLLIDWLSEPDHLTTRLLTGPGGEGKTRLANRLVGQMSGLGWAAGLLAEQVPEAVLGRVHAFRGRVLIVVDYAEGRTEQIAVLASELIARPAEHGPARLLLLARSASLWPHLLRRHRDDSISLLFTDLAERALPPVVAAPDGRPAEYARALHAFATRLGHPVPAVTVPDGLGSARYDRVLDVHAAALAALLDGAQPDTTPARRDPLLRVLDRERRYWAAAAVLHELPAPGSARHDQVVSAGTLFTAPSKAAARALLASLPTFDREGYEVTERYLRWLDALYPGPEALNPLRPDQLGEDLVATTLLDQPEFVESVAAVVGEAQVTRALTVLGRAAPRHPHVGKAMATLLTADPVARLPLAVAVATQLQDTVLVEVMVDVLIEVSASAVGLGLDLEKAVTEHLPDNSLALAMYRAASTRAALKAELHKEQPDIETVATHTHSLSLRLSAVGQHDSALVHAAQTVEMYEEMAHAEPEFTPELGTALSSLAGAYSQSGFLEEGLDAAARSCALLSRVAGGSQENLQRYATALTSHGNMLSDVARHTEAVAAAERALELAAELHDGATEKERVNRLHWLAHAQYNLSVIRAGAGLHDGALTAAEEAVRIYRDLDALSSDRFRDDLVQALDHLSGAHSELGQAKEAADLAAASLRLARDLADRHGDGYLHLMADVLNNSGVAFRRVGRYDDAVTQLTEAVALYRTLATSSPAHQLPALAGALHNLGNCLLDTKQLNKARDVYDESIDIYRKLVDPRPDTNEPDLTDSLLALADVLHEQGSTGKRWNSPQRPQRSCGDWPSPAGWFYAASSRRLCICSPWSATTWAGPPKPVTLPRAPPDTSVSWWHRSRKTFPNCAVSGRQCCSRTPAYSTAQASRTARSNRSPGRPRCCAR